MGKKIFAENGYIGRASELLVKADDFRLFLGSDYDPTRPCGYNGEKLVKRAEAILDEEYPMLRASSYMRYVRDGDRSEYESRYFDRRRRALTFLLAEAHERKGRFADQAVNGIWAILDEATWIVPAHNSGNPLPVNYADGTRNGDVMLIDLFAALTGALLALMLHIGGDILDAATPIIGDRIKDQLNKRIFEPFLEYDRDWWQGVTNRHLNNWTPWIVSNILTTAALCEKNDERRAEIVEKCMVILDRFTEPYPNDGGCDEGPGYWGAAGASYYDCAEILYDLSGGKINIYDEPLFRRMCEYIMNIRLADGFYLNFADASPRTSPNMTMIYRMGRMIGSPKLAAFAVSMYEPIDDGLININSPYRIIRDFSEKLPDPASFEPFVPEKRIWYPDLQVAITHDESGMCLAAKGGHNAESHNHNDIGQFVAFDGDIPLVIDAGVNAYTKQTFSSERYKLWAMRSVYHNVAEIGGIEQKPGGQFRAEILEYREDSGALTLELKNAYPTEAGIIGYVRSMSIIDGEVTVVDVMHLDTEKEIKLHYLLCGEPTLESGRAVLPTGHAFVFDRSLTPSVESIDTKNTKIGKDWRAETLWRLTLTATVKDAAFELKIVRGK